MIREMWNDWVDMWRDGCVGKLVSVVIAASGAIVAWLCFFCVAGLWNWWWARSLKEGVIVSKAHTDAMWMPVTTMVPAGKTSIPVTTLTYIPESWSVTFEGDDPAGAHKRRTIDVSRERWEALREGQSIRVQ